MLSDKYNEKYLGMGKFSRDKGARVEREFVHMLNDAGVICTKVPLSGAAGGAYSGDLDIHLTSGHKTHLRAEVKCRKDGTGWKTLVKWIGQNDYLFLKQARTDPLVVMPWERFIDLLVHLDNFKSEIE